MNQIFDHQPELLDRFLDELIKDPQAPAPAGLDDSTAIAARALVEVEQNLAATAPAKQPASAQIWQKVLSQVQEAEAAAARPRRAKGASRYVLAGLGLAAALALAFVTFSVLLLPGPNPAIREGGVTTPGSPSPLTASQNITATFISEAGNLDGEVRDISWAPNGEILAIALNDNTTHLWSRVSTQINTILDNQGTVHEISWSPDGRLLATIIDTNGKYEVRIWKADGSPFKVLLWNADPVSGLSWSPDSRSISAISADKTLYLWDIDSGKLSGVKKTGGTLLARSPNGKRFVIAKDNSFSVWDEGLWKQDSKPLLALEVYSGSQPFVIRVIAWSPDGKTFAMGTDSHNIRLMDSSGKLIKMLPAFGDVGSNVKSLAWSPDGKILAAATDKAKILWSSDGKLLATIPGSANTLRWSPDGQILAAAVPGKSVYFYSVQPEGDLLPASIYLDPPESFMKGGYLVAWKPDGKQFASASLDGILLWNADGSYAGLVSETLGQISSLAWSPDSSKLAVGVVNPYKVLDIFGWLPGASNSGPPGRRYDTLTGRPVDSPITALAWSPDGKTIATSSYGGKNIDLWTPDGNQIGKYTNSSFAGIISLAWSPDGKTIAIACEDKVIWLWSPETKIAEALVGHTEAVTALAWTSDSQTLASASLNGRIMLWTKTRGVYKSNINVHVSVSSLSWSPDGKVLAVAANDDFVHSYNANGDLIGKFKGMYNSVSWSPDGRALVMANLNTDLRYASMQIWRPWK
jgi:WD40 repeat protein